MLRKITSVLSILFLTAVCAAVETQTVVAEGFFAEVVKDEFAKMAISHQGESHYVLSSAVVKSPVLAIQREAPGSLLQAKKYAVYGYVLVVNETNSFDSIPLAEARKILKNQFQEWPELGIRVSRIAIADGAMPRHEIAKLVNKKTPVTVFPDADSAAQCISQEVASVAILPLSSAAFQFTGTRTLKINGIAPTPETVFSGKYPFADIYWIAVVPNAKKEIKDLYNTLLSKSFRKKLIKTGALPIL